MLESQLDRYDDIENSIDFLSSFSKGNNRNVDYAGRIISNEDGIETFNFGKHKGKTVEQVFTEEPSYFSWMMNADFPMYTKKVIERIKERMKYQQIL